MSQLELFQVSQASTPTVDLDSYDRIVVAFSGGKDSTACFLQLLELGVDLSKVELWHHEIDGREGSDLMDWVCTPDYCRQFAKQFGVPIYFSWRKGGFETEMNRDGTQLTGKVFYENADGLHETVPGKGYAKRLRFPQVGAIMSGRWCSPKLKIDVARRIFTNDKRFQDCKTLFITGERAEESSNRATYAEFEPYMIDARSFVIGETGRHIDCWRIVHKWSEKQVWAIMEKYKVRTHPCYYIGYSRCSCQFCIFGNADQWKTGAVISPERFDKLVEYEKKLDNTIDREKSLEEIVVNGEVYSGFSAEYAKVANSKEYNQTILMTNWFLPSGAYGKSCGPS